MQARKRISTSPTPYEVPPPDIGIPLTLIMIAILLLTIWGVVDELGRI